MHHIQNTPESQLPRSDSKNPATTCKGLTASGRPCRRAIASPSQPLHASASDPNSHSHPDLSDRDDVLEAHFCWQHKNQADTLANVQKTAIPLRERNSVDTLMSRLGVLNLTSPRMEEEPKRNEPLVIRREKPTRKSTKKKTRPSLLSLLCCGASADDDEVYVEVARVRRRPAREVDHRKSTTPNMPRPGTQCEPVRNAAAVESRYDIDRPPANEGNPPRRIVPATLPPHLAAQVFMEASKPISPGDKEGYIYMYWLTDVLVRPPTQASCLLDPLSAAPQNGGARLAPPPNVFADPLKDGGKSTIMVKIGRATNVHRRLSSWQQQCGYNLSLIRFYPYVPSKRTSMVPPRGDRNSGASFQNNPDSVIRKVPFSHRVERLIHLELSDIRVKQDKCTTCGKEHHEWFEIDATKEAVKRVDEVIRRWVAWAEQFAQFQEIDN